jgi:DNA-binding winged helix-turn-helix (wHTH) protein
VGEQVHFGGFTLDGGARELRRGGEVVHLPPKAFDLLELLVKRRPDAVPRAEIEARVWGKTHVSETSLPGLVGALRRALDDTGRPPRFIRTVPRFGYAFCGETKATGSAPSPSAAAFLLVLDRREVLLREGENLLGREAGAALWLDSASVSRRHARIVVSGGAATIEDLGSRNGTRVRGRPVEGVVPLADGDEITLGTVAMTFRAVHAGETEDAPG